MLQSQTFIQIRDHCVSDSYFQYYAMVASNANGAMYINQLKMYSCHNSFFVQVVARLTASVWR